MAIEENNFARENTKTPALHLKITLPVDARAEAIINLRKHLKQKGPDKVTYEIETTKEIKGQQGVGDVLNSIQAVLSASTTPLTALVNCLLEYIHTFNTEIIIGNIKIKPGKNFTPDQVTALVHEILKSHNA